MIFLEASRVKESGIRWRKDTLKLRRRERDTQRHARFFFDEMTEVSFRAEFNPLTQETKRTHAHADREIERRGEESCALYRWE